MRLPSRMGFSERTPTDRGHCSHRNLVWAAPPLRSDMIFGKHKPLEPEKYKESKAWADEVQAVIDAAKLKWPVLVGWSYGGRVIGDYLAIHGATGLAGSQLRRCSVEVRSELLAVEQVTCPGN